MRGFRNFLLRGDVIVIAVGLVVALAFSMLITSFTTNIINPIVAAAGGKNGNGLGFYVSDHNTKTFVDIGAFISAIIYFVIFIAVVYFLIVVPYKHVQARRGQMVFGDPAGSRPARTACRMTCRPPPPSASTAARTSPPWPPDPA